MKFWAETLPAKIAGLWLFHGDAEIQSTELGSNIFTGPPDVSIELSPGCIFCSIAEGKTSCYKIYEDKDYLAFLDIHPFVMGHSLVIPRKHYDTLPDMEEAAVGELFTVAARVSSRVTRGMSADGFRLIQNNGEAAAQVVKHVHIHIVPMKLEDKDRRFGRLSPTDKEFREVADAIIRHS